MLQFWTMERKLKRPVGSTVSASIAKAERREPRVRSEENRIWVLDGDVDILSTWLVNSQYVVTNRI